MRNIEIFPTTVPIDASQLAERADFVRTFSNKFHIDADDGIFTPLICWPYVSKGTFGNVDLSAARGLKTEVHLMVQDPREIGRRFAHAGAHAVFGHVETFRDADDAQQTLSSWKKEGAREAGMAILLGTSLEVLEEFVPLCDFLCFMSSAQIGAQGAQFDPRVIERIKMTHERYPELTIAVDIGVSENTISDLVRVGASRFGIGSALARSADPRAALQQLMELAEAAV